MNKLLPFALVSLAACPSPREEAVEPDAGVGTDASVSIDAEVPPACTTDGKIYVAEGLSGSLRVSRFDDVLTAGAEVADVTCPTAPTALGVLRDGSMFAALTGGQIARVTDTACTPITVSPALSGDLALVGYDDKLLALERTGGGLWRIDPMTGTAVKVATIAGVNADTSLVGGDVIGVYVPAGLGGTGKLTPLGPTLQPGTPTTITGASSTQAQADWVGLVGDAGKLWLTASGYYGAGGGRKTMWLPVENNGITYAAIEYYAPTFGVTAATCP